MKKQLQQRLEALRNESEAGQKMLAEKEREISELRQTMLRITGAVQVLEEELQRFEQSRPKEDAAAELPEKEIDMP